MLSHNQSFESLLNKILDTFFHLPTLLTIAVVCVVVLWQLSDAGLHVGPAFIRLNTNQGNMTLEWRDGCCDVDW